MDGNLRTTWTVASFDNPVGQYLRIALAHPLRTDQVNLVQPLYGPRNRWITRVTLRFDGGHPLTVKLGASSRTSAGQTVTLPDADLHDARRSPSTPPTPASRSPTTGSRAWGSPRSACPGQQVDEVLRMPEDLLDAAGASSASHRLTIVMTRQTAAPVPPATDPEIDIARTFTLPTARTLLGERDRPAVGLWSPTTCSTDCSAPRCRASPPPIPRGVSPATSRTGPRPRWTEAWHTVWSPGIGPASRQLAPLQPGPSRSPSTTCRWRSSPTGATRCPPRSRSRAGGQSRTVALPALADRSRAVGDPERVGGVPGADRCRREGHVRRGAPGDGSRLLLRRQGGACRSGSPRWTSRACRGRCPRPAQLPAPCRSDLLTVDGSPVPVTITGTTATAASLGTLAGPGLRIGRQRDRTRPGPPRGADPAGLPARRRRRRRQRRPRLRPRRSAPRDRAVRSGRSRSQSGPAPTMRVVTPRPLRPRWSCTTRPAPFWMVLGQSTNAGWHAITSTGKDLGAPQVIDGYANGWLVTPSKPGRTWSSP